MNTTLSRDFYDNWILWGWFLLVFGLFMGFMDKMKITLASHFHSFNFLSVNFGQKINPGLWFLIWCSRALLFLSNTCILPFSISDNINEMYWNCHLSSSNLLLWFNVGLFFTGEGLESPLGCPFIHAVNSETVNYCTAFCLYTAAEQCYLCKQVYVSCFMLRTTCVACNNSAFLCPCR